MNPRMMAMMAALTAIGMGDPPPALRRKPEPPTPRRFTDARIAEAEAKRQRKRAKRAAQLHGKQGGTPE